MHRHTGVAAVYTGPRPARRKGGGKTARAGFSDLTNAVEQHMQTSVDPSEGAQALPLQTSPATGPASPTPAFASNKPPDPGGSPASPALELSEVLTGLSTRSKTKQPLSLDKAIGELDVRTPAEEAEFQSCEKIIRESCTHFGRVGQALATIKAKVLYKNEHLTFEEYCLERWGFGRSQAFRQMAAAEVHQNLAAIPGMPLPDCEAQVRPLVGLGPELAQQAWLKALSWSPDTHVPARLVKRAAKQVLKAEQPETITNSATDRKQRSRLRQSIRTGFQELLTLLLSDTPRDTLIAKVQEIERAVTAIFPCPKKKV